MRHAALAEACKWHLMGKNKNRKKKKLIVLHRSNVTISRTSPKDGAAEAVTVKLNAVFFSEKGPSMVNLSNEDALWITWELVWLESEVALSWNTVKPLGRFSMIKRITSGDPLAIPTEYFNSNLETSFERHLFLSEIVSVGWSDPFPVTANSKALDLLLLSLSLSRDRLFFEDLLVTETIIFNLKSSWSPLKVILTSVRSASDSLTIPPSRRCPVERVTLSGTPRISAEISVLLLFSPGALCTNTLIGIWSSKLVIWTWLMKTMGGSSGFSAES